MEELWSNIQVSTLHGNSTTTTMGLGPSRASPTAHVSLSLSSSSPLNISNHQKDHNNDDEQEDFDKDVQDEIFVSGPKDVVISNVISTPSFMSSLINSPFEALAVASSSATFASSPSSSLLLSSCLLNKNKRVCDEDNHESVGDRRYKRMMKNRESAARSRARRQAYTSELEMEVAQLVEENAKLREQQKKMLFSASPEIPKKATHIRSLTAPF